MIFIEELESALTEINVQRTSQGFGPVEIEARLFFNDLEPQAIKLLASHCEPLIAEISKRSPRLHLKAEYSLGAFEEVYPEIKKTILSSRYKSLIFNIDQYGTSDVKLSTIQDIMRIVPSTEIFYTFAIQALLTYLSQKDPIRLSSQLGHLGITADHLDVPDSLVSRKEWLGSAEKLVFDTLQGCAPFVSPFSIRNPNGWRYWMMHLANNYRARQVYNDLLHNNGELDHFGRSGLRMLSYNPETEGRLYLFQENDRKAAREDLLNDIPRLVSEERDGMTMSAFYEAAYSATPAHKNDIHSAIFESDELEVLTPDGGLRRRSRTISIADHIRLKPQRTLFPNLPRR